MARTPYIRWSTALEHCSRKTYFTLASRTNCTDANVKVSRQYSDAGFSRKYIYVYLFAAQRWTEKRAYPILAAVQKTTKKPITLDRTTRRYSQYDFYWRTHTGSCSPQRSRTLGRRSSDGEEPHLCPRQYCGMNNSHGDSCPVKSERCVQCTKSVCPWMFCNRTWKLGIVFNKADTHSLFWLRLRKKDEKKMKTFRKVGLVGKDCAVFSGELLGLYL